MKADDSDQTGTNGSCKWTYNASSKTLTISPKGTTGTLQGGVAWPVQQNAAIIIIEPGVYADADSQQEFGFFPELTEVKGAQNLNVSKVKNMRTMFSGDNNLVSIDVSNWDTGNVTNMDSMFHDDSKLTALNVAKWDTSKVKNMESLFDNDLSLASLDVSHWKTGNVTNMSSVFYADKALKTLDVSNWDTSNVEKLFYTFGACNSLTELDVSKWNTPNVTNMNATFVGDSSLPSLNVSHFDTSKVTDMELMFGGCSSLEKLDVSNFVTDNVTNMSNMFGSDSNLTALNLSNFNTDKVTNMKQMFLEDTNLQQLNLSSFNTKLVTRWDGLFWDCPNLWKLTLGKDFAVDASVRLSDVPGDNRIIPDSDPNGAQYKNTAPFWVPVETGTDHQPAGKENYWTSNKLMTERPAITETYVWQQSPVKDLTDVKVQPQINLPINGTWTPESAFISATDANGNPVTFNKITVGGDQVNTRKPGQYNVSYTYGSKTVWTKVVVSPDATSIKVNPEVDLTVGESWSPTMGFISATDAQGKPVSFSNIRVGGDYVDTTKAGTYYVTYTNGKMSATTKVVVKAKTTPSTPTPQPTPGNNGNGNAGENGQQNVQKNTVVYGINKLYLYKHVNFNKSQRIMKYVQKPRINRPMFVVLGDYHDSNGQLRFKVRDVNHHSKSDGKIGYITGSWNYVRPVYYQSDHKTLTVINPTGVNAYRNKNLTGKTRNIKQGTKVKVVKFVRHNLTTRYVLTNGMYITGNRKLVKFGNVKFTKHIKVKKTIYRYRDANLAKKNGTIRKGSILKVKKTAYSQKYNPNKYGSLRYQVSGGWITGNGRYVKAFK
ncbi:cell wall anchor domain protein [Lentilactobacillus sunkii DSM 19904]|uniref:Cell wall anchor domain protein n=1 Tax=Lentilactobacillus sunkii DSM 19904 TaxID=1423808 RepID=A0A0R1L0L3_9LACO|nr:cell wall anchor domain protein [Lentilactobacillus sunkii DSM 19904]